MIEIQLFAEPVHAVALDRNDPRMMLTGQRIRKSYGQSGEVRMVHFRKEGRTLRWLAILGVGIYCLALDTLPRQCCNELSTRLEVAVPCSDRFSARRTGHDRDRQPAEAGFRAVMTERVTRGSARTKCCQRIRSSSSPELARLSSVVSS